MRAAAVGVCILSPTRKLSEARLSSPTVGEAEKCQRRVEKRPAENST